MVLFLAALAAASAPLPDPAPSPAAARDEDAMPAAPDAVAAAEDAPKGPTLSLGRAVALAVEQNFGLLSAADSVRSARLRESTSRASFYPRLTPAYSYSDTTWSVGLQGSQRLPWSGATLEAASTYNRVREEESPLPRASSLQLTLTQPLLRGFGPNATYFELTNTRRAREGEERSFELARQRLAVDVTRAFFRVIQQRQLLRVARQSFERNQKLQQASEARLQVGLVSKLDVFRAQLQASEAEAAMIRSETSLESALEQLRVLLGLDPTDPVEPEDVVLEETLEATEPPLEELVARARTNRLDLQEARAQVGDASRALSLARQNLLPQLDLKLGLSRLGRGLDFGSSFAAPDQRFTFALTTSYPLQRTQPGADKALAALAREQSERSLRQKELNVEAEVRNARREITRIRRSVELQRRSVEVAEKQHRLALLRYERGLASNFDVVDAESNLVLARSALVTLLTDYHVARVDLLRVTGELDLAREFRP